MAIKKTVPPLVFFGTGPVAAKCLALLAKNFDLEAVITKPKPDHHRGSSPVIDVATSLGVPIHSASNKQQLDELFASHPVKGKLAVLIDFGIIVSQMVIDYFPLGIVNSHFSVLPDLRGADPITFAILSGQKQTGVSLMLLVEAMDEGQLIGYGEYDIPSGITTPQLTEDLILLSDALLKHNLPRVIDGTVDNMPQNVTGRKLSYSRRLSKEDGLLDWSKPAVQLERQVRAYLGWPGSRTTIANKEVTITSGHVVPGSGKSGKVYATKSSLSIQTVDHRLAIDRLKPAGKTEMDIKSFMAGYGQKLVKS